jgi:hypothetical protein
MALLTLYDWISRKAVKIPAIMYLLRIFYLIPYFDCLFVPEVPL